MMGTCDFQKGIFLNVGKFIYLQQILYSLIIDAVSQYGCAANNNELINISNWMFVKCASNEDTQTHNNVTISQEDLTREFENSLNRMPSNKDQMSTARPRGYGQPQNLTHMTGTSDKYAYNTDAYSNINPFQEEVGFSPTNTYQIEYGNTMMPLNHWNGTIAYSNVSADGVNYPSAYSSNLDYQNGQYPEQGYQSSNNYQQCFNGFNPAQHVAMRPSLYSMGLESQQNFNGMNMYHAPYYNDPRSFLYPASHLPASNYGNFPIRQYYNSFLQESHNIMHQRVNNFNYNDQSMLNNVYLEDYRNNFHQQMHGTGFNEQETSHTTRIPLNNAKNLHDDHNIINLGGVAFGAPIPHSSHGSLSSHTSPVLSYGSHSLEPSQTPNHTPQSINRFNDPMSIDSNIQPNSFINANQPLANEMTDGTIKIGPRVQTASCNYGIQDVSFPGGIAPKLRCNVSDSQIEEIVNQQGPGYITKPRANQSLMTNAPCSNISILTESQVNQSLMTNAPCSNISILPSDKNVEIQAELKPIQTIVPCNNLTTYDKDNPFETIHSKQQKDAAPGEISPLIATHEILFGTSVYIGDVACSIRMNPSKRIYEVVPCETDKYKRCKTIVMPEEASNEPVVMGMDTKTSVENADSIPGTSTGCSTSHLPTGARRTPLLTENMTQENNILAVVNLTCADTSKMNAVAVIDELDLKETPIIDKMGITSEMIKKMMESGAGSIDAELELKGGDKNQIKGSGNLKLIPVEYPNAVQNINQMVANELTPVEYPNVGPNINEAVAIESAPTEKNIFKRQLSQVERSEGIGDLADNQKQENTPIEAPLNIDEYSVIVTAYITKIQKTPITKCCFVTKYKECIKDFNKILTEIQLRKSRYRSSARLLPEYIKKMIQEANFSFINGKVLVDLRNNKAASYFKKNDVDDRITIKLSVSFRHLYKLHISLVNIKAILNQSCYKAISILRRYNINSLKFICKKYVIQPPCDIIEDYDNLIGVFKLVEDCENYIYIENCDILKGFLSKGRQIEGHTKYKTILENVPHGDITSHDVKLKMTQFTARVNVFIKDEKFNNKKAKIQIDYNKKIKGLLNIQLSIYYYLFIENYPNPIETHNVPEYANISEKDRIEFVVENYFKYIKLISITLFLKFLLKISVIIENRFDILCSLVKENDQLNDKRIHTCVVFLQFGEFWADYTMKRINTYYDEIVAPSN